MPDLILYTDAHIHVAVADQLRERGVDVLRCEEAGLKEASDLEHLEFAVSQSRAVISGDTDFLRLHTAWSQTHREHRGIFFILPEVRHQSRAAIGIIVNELWFYYEAVRGEAATLEQDVYNKIVYIGMK